MRRVLLAGLILCLAGQGWGATKYVSPSGDNTDGSTWAKAYTSIAYGITGASASDTLEVEGGATYTGAIVVGKALTIKGSTAAGHSGVVTLTAATGTNLVGVTAASVRLTGLRLLSTSSLTRNVYWQAGANSGIIDNCVFDGPVVSLIANSVATLSVYNNKFLDGYCGGTTQSISFEGTTTASFHHNIVTPNNTTSAGGGLPGWIRIKDTSAVTVYNNTLVGFAGKVADVATATATLTFKNNVVVAHGKAVGGSQAILTNTGNGTLTESNTCYLPDGESPETAAPYNLGVTATAPVVDTPKFTAQGYKKGFVSISSDDGSASAVSWAMSLETLGVPFTWYIDKARFLALPDNTFAPYSNGQAYLRHLVAAGHEIGIHSNTHNQLAATTSAFTVSGSRTDPTINVDRTANTITAHDTEGGDSTISAFKTKSILEIRTALAAITGFSTTGSSFDADTGESLADSGGAKSCSSAYSMLVLKDNTAVTGFYKDEIADVKAWMEGYIGGGYVVKTMSPPGSSTNAGVRAAQAAAGLAGGRGGTVTGGSRYLPTVEIQNVSTWAVDAPIFGSGAAESPVVLTRNGKAVAEYAVSLGGVYGVLMHGIDNMPIASFAAFVDGIKAVPNVEIVTLADIVSEIKTSGLWASSDNVTYTRAFTDQSDYRPLPGSPLIGAGVGVGLATDFAGNLTRNPPAIGAYEDTSALSTADPADGNVMLFGFGTGAAGYVLKDSATTETSADLFAADAARQYVSTTFVPTATYDIRRVEVRLHRSAPYTGVLTMYIYATTGANGSPTGEALATSTNTFSQADLTTTPGAYLPFDFAPGVTLNSGTRYAFVVYSSTTNGSAYVYLWRATTTGIHMYKSADGATWASWVSNNSAAIKLYSYE